MFLLNSIISATEPQLFTIFNCGFLVGVMALALLTDFCTSDVKIMREQMNFNFYQLSLDQVRRAQLAWSQWRFTFRDHKDTEYARDIFAPMGGHAGINKPREGQVRVWSFLSIGSALSMKRHCGIL